MTHASSSPWQLVWSTHFTQAAPRGSFSHCASGHICTGLPASLRSQWWAYPDGAPDTSTLEHLRVHGYYSPSTTVWISGGVMNIMLWRATGTVHSAALLPKAAMDRRYGQYVERFRVLNPLPGYISAHMLYTASGSRVTDGSAWEIDFPNGSGWGEPIYAFVHFPTHRPWFESSATFGTAWHTTVEQWTPAGIWFWIDGHLLGHIAGRVSDIPMNWVLQNETNVNPAHPSPPPNSSSTMQISYAAYYAYG